MSRTKKEFQEKRGGGNTHRPPTMVGVDQALIHKIRAILRFLKGEEREVVSYPGNNRTNHNNNQQGRVLIPELDNRDITEIDKKGLITFLYEIIYKIKNDVTKKNYLTEISVLFRNIIKKYE